MLWHPTEPPLMRLQLQMSPNHSVPSQPSESRLGTNAAVLSPNGDGMASSPYHTTLSFFSPKPSPGATVHLFLNFTVHLFLNFTVHLFIFSCEFHCVSSCASRLFSAVLRACFLHTCLYRGLPYCPSWGGFREVQSFLDQTPPQGQS